MDTWSRAYFLNYMNVCMYTGCPNGSNRLTVLPRVTTEPAFKMQSSLLKRIDTEGGLLNIVQIKMY